MSNIYFHNVELALYVALAVSAIALLLVYIFRLRRFKLVKKHASWQIETQEIEAATHEAISHDAEGNYPYISVVIPCNEQSADIQSLIANLLKQNYKGKFEIIVADESHSADLKALVGNLNNKHPNVRYTFVPESSRYIELRKLAITLGIKASRGEWVIVINPETQPASNDWLQCYVQNLGDDVDFAEAYYNYDDDGTLLARRAIFERIDDFSLRIYAWENGVVIGCPQANWAVRKNWFIKENGFADSLNIAFGEEAIFANYKVRSDNYVMLCSPATRLIEEMPSSAQLSSQRMQKAEINRHLSGAAKLQLLTSGLSTFMSYMYALCLLFYTFMRVWHDVQATDYTSNYLYADIVALLLWCVGLYIPLYIVREALRTLDERKYGLYIYIYEMLRPFHAISTACKRRIHHSEFTRKYI